MLSLVLLAFDAPARPLRPEAVARSLASLVEASISGLIGDAALLGPAGRELAKIADAAGCALIESEGRAEGFAKAAASARRADIFVLEAGYAIERGFVDEVSDLFDHGEPLVLRAAPDSFVTRLAPQFSSVAGIIAPKSAMREAGVANLSALARKLKGADLTTRARRVF